MRISGRLLRGENHNPPFFTSILLSVRVAGEKKAAVYAKLHNRPEGQGEGVFDFVAASFRWAPLTLLW
jgi:hypothetical protein